MPDCVEPGCYTQVKDGRCQQHRIESPTYLERDWPERKRRAQAVADWVAEHGHWCPGYGVPAHPSTDLTADHSLAVAHGGAQGPLDVLCRPCNARKGAREPKKPNE